MILDGLLADLRSAKRGVIARPPCRRFGLALAYAALVASVSVPVPARADAQTDATGQPITVAANQPSLFARRPLGPQAGAETIPPFLFGGSAFIGESYVGNGAGLSKGGRSDYVSTLGVSAYLHDLGSRFSFDATYTGTVDFYARGTQQTQFSNNLQLLGDVIVVPDYLSINAKAFATPVVDSQVGILTAGNRLVANGFHSSYGFEVEPKLTFRLGDFANSETMPLYGSDFFTNAAGSTNIVIPGLPGPQDINVRGITQSITSGTDFDRLNWNVIGAFVETKRKQGLLSDKEGTSTFKYALSREWALLATGGYEAITNTTPLAKNVSGLIAMGGFALTLGDEFTMQLQGGEKYHDASVIGQLHYSWNPASSIVGSLTDTVSVPESQLLSQLDNLVATNSGQLTSADNLLPNGSAASLSNFDLFSLGGGGGLTFDQNISRYQSANISWLEDLERNHLNLGVFATRRTFISGVLIGPPRTDSWGAQLQYGRDINPQLRATLGGSYYDTQELGGLAQIYRFDGELHYLMTREMELEFLGNYVRRNSSASLSAVSPLTGSLNDFRIEILLRRSF